MKPVGLVMDPCFEEHLTGPGHPERPERLAAVRAALEGAGLAARLAAGRIVSVLEGGYDLEALAGSTAAHLRVLLGGSGHGPGSARGSSP